MTKTFASVGKRYHRVSAIALEPGQPNLALCGTIYIPDQVGDNNSTDLPWCRECHIEYIMFHEDEVTRHELTVHILKKEYMESEAENLAGTESESSVVD